MGKESLQGIYDSVVRALTLGDQSLFLKTALKYYKKALTIPLPIKGSAVAWDTGMSPISKSRPFINPPLPYMVKLHEF